MKKKYSIPMEVEASIQLALKKYSVDLTDTKRIAESVLRLSDFYIENPKAITPWDENWSQIAYLSYFFPLNFLRAQKVIEQGHQVGFFQSLETLIDFGSGLGSASRSLREIPKQIFVESSFRARELHQALFEEKDFLQSRWENSFDSSIGKNTLGLFSYSLTELEQLPTWTQDCEALMIIEPATRQDGRKLLQLRSQLIESGFHMWAPCTHQQSCPLLVHSPSDWCHDRVHFAQPKWFQEIENRLPIKNQTLTMSYLLARKTSPPDLSRKARMTGDRLVEKGKTRQLICRGPEREFLTWMDRDWKKGVEEIPRGTLIDFPENSEKKSNEIRIKSIFS